MKVEREEHEERAGLSKRGEMEEHEERESRSK